MLDEKDKKDIRKMIDEALSKAMEYQVRKRGDTPTDDLQLTPRKYVNANGSVASRPAGSIAQIGQHYFASDTNRIMFFTPQLNWVDGVASVIAN